MTKTRALRLSGVALLIVGASMVVGPPASADIPFNVAVERDLGLSPRQAEARFAQQDHASAIESRLRDTLGAAFGGAHFDPSTGKLVVGVTDPAMTAVVRAAGAEATEARYSQRELDGIKSMLDETDAPAGVTGWYVDVYRNRVVVEVNRAAATRETSAYLDRLRALGPAVRVAEVTSSPRALYNVRGGDAWTTLAWRCSVGFSATGSGGSRHFVTAGHCTQGAGPAYGYNDEQMGSLGGSTFSLFGDYGKVDVTSAAWTLAGTVNRYGGGDIAVKGSTEAPIGASVCRSGSTTGWHCGTIKAKNRTVIYINGGAVGGLTQTDACAEPGDSGGSFITGTGQAQGMTSGGSGDCTDGGETYFQPVNEALTAYGLRIVTS
ncbi:S1 family peptidase [Micromonospora deserti]|uniref:Serine protease n=1 Tax=Micromonospora deserti TaxID=2070366 RepID=A0A2W2CTK5_9ACTN|nr:S1 family peptidase [Micromonospora deserti]PZG02836.1 serine protease [Micromonospora deserti]